MGSLERAGHLFTKTQEGLFLPFHFEKPSLKVVSQGKIKKKNSKKGLHNTCFLKYVEGIWSSNYNYNEKRLTYFIGPHSLNGRKKVYYLM